MGCVSSNLLNQDEELQLGLGNHMVSLTSTTYGLLSMDPHPHPPQKSEERAEVINSWELMSGLENEKPKEFELEERFEKICPPKGEKRVVIYTTTLRGVRRTFEACNAVRSALEAFGVVICERDVSMDSGFREELKGLLKGKDIVAVPPRVFVKGFYIGGAEEMLKISQQGILDELLKDLPRKNPGSVCKACADMRFFPCFNCNGSRKTLVNQHLIKCTHCNENGLVLCPLCT